LFIEVRIAIESISQFSYAYSFIHNLPEIDLRGLQLCAVVYDFDYDGPVIKTENIKFIGTLDYSKD